MFLSLILINIIVKDKEENLDYSIEPFENETKIPDCVIPL